MASAPASAPGPAKAPSTRRAAPALRRAVPALIAAALWLGPAPAAAADDPAALAYPPAEPVRARHLLVSGGLEFPVSGDQGVQPQAAAYLDLPRNLQAGVKARVDLQSAAEPYDYVPQAGLHLRQLWLSDQDTSTVRNSEYISLAAGIYPAYDFEGKRAGIEPFVAVALGKYWVPFDNRPYGLDFCIEIARFLNGHPPGRSRTFYLTAGVNLFRAFAMRKR